MRRHIPKCPACNSLWLSLPIGVGGMARHALKPGLNLSASLDGCQVGTARKALSGMNLPWCLVLDTARGSPSAEPQRTALVTCGSANAANCFSMSVVTSSFEGPGDMALTRIRALLLLRLRSWFQMFSHCMCQ